MKRKKNLKRKGSNSLNKLSLFKKNALLDFIHGEEEGTLVTLN